MRPGSSYLVSDPFIASPLRNIRKVGSDRGTLSFERVTIYAAFSREKDRPVRGARDSRDDDKEEDGEDSQGYDRFDHTYTSLFPFPLYGQIADHLIFDHDNDNLRLLSPRDLLSLRK